MDKLKTLMARCKCGVDITINDHRNEYKSASDALDDLDAMGLCHLSPEVRAKIIETDTLIDLHFYPVTPVGFCKILHYDIDAAFDAALACLPTNVADSAEDSR